MNSTLARRAFRNAWQAAATLLLAAAGTALAQTTTFTSGGAEVRAFWTRNINTVYAAAYGGGLWVSSNTGSTWSRISVTPSNVRYLTAVDGKATLLVVGGDEGLARSTDFTNFTQILHEPVSAVAVAPTGNTVLAGIKGMGIVRSIDNAASFAPANNAGFDSLDIVAIAFDPSNANTVYAAAKPDGTGARGGVFRSADGGATWAAYNTGLPNRYVASLTVDSAGTTYVGLLDTTRQGDVYARASGAGSWGAASGDIFGGVASLHRDANAGTTIWAGSSNLGLQKGSGTAFTYQFAHDGQQNILFTGINAVATFPTDPAVVLKAVKGAGVWRSTANVSPRTWTQTKFGGADRVRAATGVTGQPNTILMGLHAGGVWKSTTGLAGTYEHPTVNNTTQAAFALGVGAGTANPFTTIWDLSASTTSANVIYAAAPGIGMHYVNDSPGLFRWNGSVWQGLGTVDSGAPYNIVNEPGTFVGQAIFQQPFGILVHRSDENTAYLGSLTGFPLRKRTGTTWFNKTYGAGSSVRSIVPSLAAPTKTMALLFGDKPGLSTDSGENYATVSVSQTGFEFMRFFSAAENPVDSSVWVAATNKGLYRSTDGGSSWTRITMDGVFTQLAMTAVGFRPGTAKVFAADFEGNRYCSGNGGIAWTALAGKLNAGVNAIRTIGSDLFYMTDGAGMVREDAVCP